MKNISGNRLIYLGIITAFIFWFFDVFIDTYWFKEDALFENLLGHDTMEIWMRILITFMIIGFSVYANQIVSERDQSVEEHKGLITELQEALEQVKTLKGLIPICASCKKVRDDKGFWKRIEAYVSTHSEAEFTHGYCPECSKDFIHKFNPKD